MLLTHPEIKPLGETNESFPLSLSFLVISPAAQHLQLDFQLFALIILNCTFPICGPVETPSDPPPLQISHPCGFPRSGGKKPHTGNMQSGYMLIPTLSVSGEQ